MKNNCSALILAAGLSSRMGKNKFSLRLLNGKTFLENIIESYMSLNCKQIILVTNKDGSTYYNSMLKDKFNSIYLIDNQNIELGRFHSLKLGLNALSSANKIFIHNVDNPFADIDILQMMLANSNDTDFVKINYEGRGGHPILINQEIAKAIVDSLREGFNFKTVLKSFKGRNIESSSQNILFNINTQEDYDNYIFAK